jgi:hypothetical protein
MLSQLMDRSGWGLSVGGMVARDEAHRAAADEQRRRAQKFGWR